MDNLFYTFHKYNNKKLDILNLILPKFSNMFRVLFLLIFNEQSLVNKYTTNDAREDED